jgi:murein DD-endopeptidase MepM/ murein hydrolase activator NlpD
MLQAMPASAISLILPTGNDAIYSGADSAFYQYATTSRDNPWESGKFGYVRNPRKTSGGMMFTRFHEGIDIKPLYRDNRGKPLDSVRSVDDGVVVHANATAGHSNYGRYIVVRHIWDGSPYYSLYAHLNEVWVDSGATVHQGDPIGRLGYTGVGINRTRAHLHFEIGLLLNEHFQNWYDRYYPKDPNHNGIYNGQNLAGVDVARLYLALRENPKLTMQEFLADEEPSFRIEVPGDRKIDLLARYPWLLSPAEDSGDGIVVSWSICFTPAGLPLRVIPSYQEIAGMMVSRERTVPFICRYIRGKEVCVLTESGERYIELLTATDGEKGEEKASR